MPPPRPGIERRDPDTASTMRRPRFARGAILAGHGRRHAEADMATSQSEKARRFRALHEREGVFVIPNPWDVGSARILASMGFEALATTSMGHAFSVGKRDGSLGREKKLAYASAIAAATNLPVSADLENCFGDSPQTVGETIRLAGETGIVGGSVEDATGRKDDPIYDMETAVDRVSAAVKATHSLPFTFTLTARAENFL